MALIVKNEDSPLKFLYRKYDFVTPSLHQFLCNSVVQPTLLRMFCWVPDLHKNT